jgi:uncharacterized cupredoxin-like copper-binding protein
MRAFKYSILPLIALAASSAHAQVTATVPVTLSNFRFTPNQIVLQHGQPYVLRLTNAASGGHSFAAGPFFAGSSVSAADRPLIKNGVVEVPAGQVREIHLLAPGPGRYDLKCSHFLHASFGMKGNIIVQ